MWISFSSISELSKLFLISCQTFPGTIDLSWQSDNEELQALNVTWVVVDTLVSTHQGSRNTCGIHKKGTKACYEILELEALN